MIYQKIFTTEERIKSDLKSVIRRLVALNSIKKTLSQIDFSAETVSVNDPERLKAMITDLKGEDLSDYEKSVVDEITGSFTSSSQK
jgi:hypothetical protein